MEFETYGNFYPIFQIKQDLSKEKAELMDALYTNTSSGFFGAINESLTDEEAALMSLRIAEITRIEQGIKLGYYKSP